MLVGYVSIDLNVNCWISDFPASYVLNSKIYEWCHYWPSIGFYNSNNLNCIGAPSFLRSIS